MLSVYRLVSLAFIALSLFQVVDAYSARTNGQRLARGLPPARPKRLYVGARNNMARGDPSAIPTSATSDPVVPSTSVSVPSSTPIDTSSIPSSSPVDTSSSVDTPTETPSSTPVSTLPTSSPSDTPTSTPVDTPTSTPSSTPVDTPSSTPPSSTPSTPTQTGVVGIYSTQSSIATRKKRDSRTFIGYIGAYGIVQSPPSSDASSGWEYSYVVPDPLDAVVELSHTGTPPLDHPLPPTSTIPTLLVTRKLPSQVPLSYRSFTRLSNVINMQFSIDPVTGEITVRWVNPDGSLPKTYIVQSGTILYVTGDVAALQRSLGTTDTTIVTTTK
ncbi:hypothetical protein PHLCEN_2v7033 [Hermanssonia centrifuga]|uniref:Uncharacterized protein n=1 Tax=Hermanssonia centrifuga TaxID=98765 RepID=A0A2R6NXP1_9APHY|nr:hypothetical protein PHLCEN_2v7033 [Hermanssonia centrifuga]